MSTAAQPQPKLGIAIITYGRPERLEMVLQRVSELTESAHELVVAEDGADHGLVHRLRDRGVRVVSGPNRGVCWNKNRGLFALMTLGCDPILLLEDDIYPVVHGWEREWICATEKWDHLSFAHDKIRDQVIEGNGTAAAPYVNRKATAQCTAVSERALRAVGFFDTRFVGYGVGHAEWTTRIKRAGYGFVPVTLEDGTEAKANLYIHGGLKADDAESYRDNAQVRANQDLFRRIKRDPVFRWPWSTAEDRDRFIDEQREAGLDLTERSAALVESWTAEATASASSRATGKLTINSRKHKWDTGDVFALGVLAPLAGDVHIPWTSFSLRPAALLTVVNEVSIRRPRVVLECGGGASTFYLARALQQNGQGRIITVESDAEWADYLRRALVSTGLEAVVRVIHAPLRAWSEPSPPPDDTSRGDNFTTPDLWYDVNPVLAALDDEAIDILLVDGPPGSKRLNRYPAVPAFHDLLAEGATIFLDDANRPAERETARRWAELTGLDFTVYERMSLAVGRRSGFTLLGT